MTGSISALANAIGDDAALARGLDRSPTTVAFPASVKRSLSSARRALARSIELLVVSIQPAPMSSPVRTLPAFKSSSCCSILACSCLHQAMKRSEAALVFALGMAWGRCCHGRGEAVPISRFG